MDTCVHLSRYPSDTAIPTQQLWQGQDLRWIDSLQLSLIGILIGISFVLLQFNTRELLSPGIPSASYCHPNAAAVQALTWQGQDLVSPESNAALHPLAIPIAEGPISFWGADAQDTVTCLLRWPAPAAHPGMEMPIVAMQRGARSMVLVARNPTEYLTRLLLEEDIACESGGGERLLAAELGDAGRELYEAGAYTAANVKKFEAFVIAKVGHFPDVSQSLVQGHRDKGDEARAHFIYLLNPERGAFFGAMVPQCLCSACAQLSIVCSTGSWCAGRFGVCGVLAYSEHERLSASAGQTHRGHLAVAAQMRLPPKT